MSLFGGNPTFAFRIVIRSLEGRGFDNEEEIPDLISSQERIKLSCEVMKKSPGEQKEFDKLILKAGGFVSENEASQYLKKIIDSIYLSGLLFKSPYKIIDFDIFKEDKSFFMIGGIGGVSLGLSMPILLSSFGDNLNNAANLIDKLDKKQLLALELYNLVHFETSKRTKFVILITAIECLTKQEKNSPQLIEQVDKLIKIAEESDIEQKEYLINRLQNIKSESHLASCKRFIKEKLGKEEEIIAFKKYYNIRGDIVHDGREQEGINLDHQLSGLNNLISKLLNAAISEVN